MVRSPDPLSSCPLPNCPFLAPPVAYPQTHPRPHQLVVVAEPLLTRWFQISEDKAKK